jgi:hypothetical protein
MGAVRGGGVNQTCAIPSGFLKRESKLKIYIYIYQTLIMDIKIIFNSKNNSIKRFKCKFERKFSEWPPLRLRPWTDEEYSKWRTEIQLEKPYGKYILGIPKCRRDCNIKTGITVTKTFEIRFKIIWCGYQSTKYKTLGNGLLQIL